MPVSVIAKLFYPLHWVLLLVSTSLSAETFSIETAQISQIGNGHVLNATVKYPLTLRVIEAIDNGVPITFVQKFQIIKSLPLLGDYWHWNEKVWESKIISQLKFHALTEQYVLVNLGTKHQRNYSSLDIALHALGTINNFNLPPDVLYGEDNLVVQLRSELDLNALPTPMRPGALISSKWHLSSPWVTAEWQ